MHEFLISAVDFGSKKISASLGKEFEDDIDILGTANTPSSGIEKGFIQDEEKCVISLKEAIHKLEQKTNKKIESVYCGISCRGLRITETNVSIILSEGKVRGIDLKKAIESNSEFTLLDGEEIVDTIINYYILDEKILYENIIGYRGNDLKINLTLVIGPKNELMKFKQVVKAAGYEFKGFIVNSIAGKNIFLQGKKSMGVKVIVDIGGGTTDISIFRNGVLKYIKSIKIGGNNITKDISICGKLSLDESENLKKILANKYETILNDSEINEELEVGATKISKSLFYEVTKARIEEILKYVNNEIKNTSFCEGMCSIIIYGDGITYYENVARIAKEQIDKNITIADSKYLQMKNTANISSLAIVKEIFDRFKLIASDPVKDEFEVAINEKINRDYDILEEDESIMDNEKGFFAKIKSFIKEIF